MSGCYLCKDYGIEKGDTLYRMSDWDGGIGFDYIHDIQFCPVCGRKLTQWGAEEVGEVQDGSISKFGDGERWKEVQE